MGAGPGHASTVVTRPALGRGGRGLARLGWGTAGAFVILLVTAFLRTDTAGVPLRAGVLALGVLASFAPPSALLVLAGLSPFSTMLTALAGVSLSGTALAEAMVLATTGPWMLRTALAPPAVPAASRRIAPAAVVFALLALSSCVVQLAVVMARSGGAAFAGDVWTFVSRGYFERSIVFNVMTVTGALVEGVVLLLMTATLCARAPYLRDRLPLIMITATAGMAVLNLNRLLAAALRSEAPLQALPELWWHTRISAHYDRNAAGSVFSMVAFVAAGSLGASRRRRVYVGCALLLVAAGLWLSGSRAALAATVVMAAAFAAVIGWHRTDRRQWRYGALAGAAVLALGLALAALYPANRNNKVAGSVDGRRELAIAALRMSAAHPVFGIGIGRFYDLSDKYGRPQLPSVLSPGSTRENSHNNFLQVLGELGLTGLAALLWLLTVALLPAIRAARGGVELPASAALAAGAIAYVLTWLTGHPLLVPEALYPFFMVLGLTAAAGAMPIDTAPPMRPARASVAGTVAIILLLIGLPLRVATAIGEANLEDVGYELSGWQRDGQGERFRIAGARSTLFVPSDAGAVNLPLRRVPGKGPVEVEVLLDGRPADRVQLAGDGWKIVRLVVPTVRARYRRVDLRARATAAGEIPALMVGRARSVYGETRDVPVPPGPARTGRTAGDYDGDGSADPAVYQQSKGVWRIEKVGTIQHGGPGDRPVPADYNGDGIVDLAVYHPSDGQWLVRGQPTLQFGEPSDIPVPGDYDGDGRIDLAVFRPSTGTWYVRNKSATAWGDPGDVPVPGDYDGDHVTDLAVYRPSNGTWYVRNQPLVQFGDPGDVPMPGDYDGNGTIDFAVYRPSSGKWYVLKQLVAQYGTTGDIPVPGDYNGDRVTDLAVYRPSTGDWFVRR